MSLGQDKGPQTPAVTPARDGLTTLASAALFGTLIGIISPMQGTPWFLIPLVVAIVTGAALFVRMGTRGETSFLLRSLKFLRRIPKATQYLLISFCVTTIFAMELRFDIVPNRYGFLELLVPVAIFAILFDASGGLFCAALTIAYAFQALAPPRFAPVMDPQVPYAGALLAFSSIALLTAIFFAAQTRGIRTSGSEQDELAHMGRSLAAAGQSVGQAVHRRLSMLRTHALPGIALILIYALVWAAFATISTGRGLHGDSLEAYTWGREFDLGYYKHPPFWSWVAGVWFAVFPKTNFSFWFLSELNGAIGLAGAWALIGRFGSRRMQMLGVLLLMITPFYQFNAQRFNANTILLSIWPWTLYFFVRSIETRRIFHALLCGILAGFALLSKYYGAILVATCFLAALTHHGRRDYFRSAAPYVSTVAAFFVFLPHLLWLVKDGFQPFFYLADRIDKADRAIANQYFEFIFGNLAFFILPAALLVFARWRGGPEEARPDMGRIHGPSFVNVLTFAPFVLTLVAGTVGHTALGIPFAVSILALVPPLMVSLINPSLDHAVKYTRILVGVVIAACLAVSAALPYLYLRFDESHYSMPRDEMADAAMDIWKRETGLPLRFVSGERDYAMAVVFRSKENTSDFNNFNFRWAPWVTREGLKTHGLLAICQQSDESCNRRANRFAGPGSKVVEHTIQRQIWTAIGRPWAFNVYVIPPNAMAD
ncbi:MAG: hypothetical protein RIQ68_417 [Pseudomonadota bacterium]